MSHYDCDYCGKHMTMCESTCKRFEAPPIGLRPKHIVDAERIQEIKEAIVRYVLAGKEVPQEWQQELFDLRGSTF
jgi:hypothetical protein